MTDVVAHVYSIDKAGERERETERKKGILGDGERYPTEISK
jgi:hypothetical protein